MNTNTFAEHGQSGEEIAEIIHSALNDEKPHLRYLTSEYTSGFAGLEYSDLTGDGVVDLFHERLQSPS